MPFTAFHYFQFGFVIFKQNNFGAKAARKMLLELSTGGDILASRCTMVNDGENDVFVGPTRKDEMCNFYVMYWVEGNKIPSDNFCFSMGPPYYAWDGSGLSQRLPNIPDKEASTYDE